MGSKRRWAPFTSIEKLLAAEIRKYRDRRGWNQRDMAEYLGTTQSVISDWEQGVVGFQLANATRVAALIGWKIAMSRTQESDAT